MKKNTQPNFQSMEWNQGDFQIPKMKKINKKKVNQFSMNDLQFSENPNFDNYVKKSMAVCLDMGEKQEMIKLLKEIKDRTISKGTFIHENWNQTPVPILKRQKKQQLFDPNPMNLDFYNQNFMNYPAYAQPSYPNSPQLQKQYQKKITKQISQVQPERQQKTHYKKNQNKKKPKFSNFNESPIKLNKNSNKIIGTCKNLEKKYLRLTEDPDPSTIRPLHILKQSFRLIMSKYESGMENSDYIIDQFRSLRQDILVQDIRSDFTVNVYETNALVAIELKDYYHFLKCLSQLKDLYRQGFQGQQNDFYLLQIVSLVLQNQNSELHDCLQSFPFSFLLSTQFKMAQKIIQNLQLDNYKYIFRQLENHEFKGLSSLVSFEIDSLRQWALTVMFNTYRPDLKLDFLVSELRFENSYLLQEFLKKIKIVVSEDKVNVGQNRKIVEKLNKHFYLS